jgi:site-specific recombinase
LVSIVAILLGSPHYDLAWLMVAILLLIAFVPVIVAIVVSLWAATRPRRLSVAPGAVPP